jgi:hypothetical protein
VIGNASIWNPAYDMNVRSVLLTVNFFRAFWRIGVEWSDGVIVKAREVSMRFQGSAVKDE